MNATTIEVWEPRYKDMKVLLAKYKVQSAQPLIRVVFTKAKHLKEFEGYISQVAAMNCPLESNSKIDCYAVPFNLLEAK